MYDDKYNQIFTEEELNKEVWKDIGECKGYEDYKGLYKVSNLGRVKNNRGLIKSPELNHKGYYRVQLYNKGKRKNKRINRLVALAFIPNPNNYPMVNHKDENKLNNRVSNLEWCTNKYNCNYGTVRERIAKTLSKVMKGKYTSGNNPNAKEVVMYDKQGNKLKEFDCIKDAERYLGKSHANTNISKCCKGKQKTAYGYKWKYK